MGSVGVEAEMARRHRVVAFLELITLKRFRLRSSIVFVGRNTGIS